MRSKNVFSFLLLFLLTSLLFSLTVFAEESECTHKEYEVVEIVFDDDFVLNGGTKTLKCTECEDTKKTTFPPFIVHIGYSTNQDSLCSSFYLSRDALVEYATLTELDLKFGFIVTSKSTLGENLPINEQFKPFNASVSMTSMVNTPGFFQDIQINNIRASRFDLEMLVTYYVIFDEQVYYIQENGPVQEYEELSFITYNMFAPEIEDFAGFTTEETLESEDRVKQQEKSEQTYNTGSELDEEELQRIKEAAIKLSLGGMLIQNYPNASMFIDHYLYSDGKNKKIDMSDFLSDEVALANRDNDLNTALYACEILARQGQYISINMKNENIYHNLTGDWQYCVGSYFTRVEISNLTIIYTLSGAKKYSATIKYSVIDFYNWDETDTEKAFDIVSPAELNELHKAGLAKDFLSYGEEVYQLTWSEGQRMTSIKNEGLIK